MARFRALVVLALTLSYRMIELLSIVMMLIQAVIVPWKHPRSNTALPISLQLPSSRPCLNVAHTSYTV